MRKDVKIFKCDRCVKVYLSVKVPCIIIVGNDDNKPSSCPYGYDDDFEFKNYKPENFTRWFK